MTDEPVPCRCNICRKEFKNFGNCQAHVRRVHGDEKGVVVSADHEVIRDDDGWRSYKAKVSDVA
jgi:hypothetical protein